MKLRLLATATAALLALSGCSTDVPVPEITMVDGKLCALADQAGWNDEGLNRETFVALQKAKVSLGIALEVDQLAANATHATAQKRLTQLAKADCTLEITSGDYLSPDAFAVATENQEAQFVSIDHHFERTSGDVGSHTALPSNLHQITNVLGEAAFQAGYLAAMSSQTHVVASLIAIGSPSTILQRKLAVAFADGVSYYVDHGGVATELITQYPVPKIAPASEAIRQTVSNLYNQGVDRLIVLAAKDFETVASVTESFTNLQLIGTELDWAVRKESAKYAPRILASVVRTKNVDSLYSYIAFWLGGQTATPSPVAIDVNDLTNAGVTLTEAHNISYPGDFANQMKALMASLTSEQGMTR